MRGGRIRPLLVLMGISLGLWIVFATLVVPAVIESAYRGESWSFLNRMISGQATHPVSDYLQDWDGVTVPGLLGVLGFWLNNFTHYKKSGLNATAVRRPHAEGEVSRSSLRTPSIAVRTNATAHGN